MHYFEKKEAESIYFFTVDVQFFGRLLFLGLENIIFL